MNLYRVFTIFTIVFIFNSPAFANNDTRSMLYQSCMKAHNNKDACLCSINELYTGNFNKTVKDGMASKELSDETVKKFMIDLTRDWNANTFDIFEKNDKDITAIEALRLDFAIEEENNCSNLYNASRPSADKHPDQKATAKVAPETTTPFTSDEMNAIQKHTAQLEFKGEGISEAYLKVGPVYGKDGPKDKVQIGFKITEDKLPYDNWKDLPFNKKNFDVYINEQKISKITSHSWYGENPVTYSFVTSLEESDHSNLRSVLPLQGKTLKLSNGDISLEGTLAVAKE